MRLCSRCQRAWKASTVLTMRAGLASTSFFRGFKEILLDAWTSRRCLALTSERLGWLHFTVNSQSPQCHQVWLPRSVSVKERPRNCFAGVHFRSASQAAWRATLFWIRSCTRFFLASAFGTCTFCRASSYQARHSRLRVWRLGIDFWLPSKAGQIWAATWLLRILPELHLLHFQLSLAFTRLCIPGQALAEQMSNKVDHRLLYNIGPTLTPAA